jgi:hypothetical protein
MRKLIISALTFLSFVAQANDNSWKLIAVEQDIKVFAQETTKSLIPFKATGVINAKIEDVFTILKDHKTKHNWAPKLKLVNVHAKPTANQFIFSEYYKTPWPAKDREFLLKGSYKIISPKHIKLSATSVLEGKYFDLKDQDHIQADVKHLNIELVSIAKNQTQLTFEFHGDMKGWIPKWLSNLIQKKWPLRFIQALQAHSNEHKAGIRSLPKNAGLD